MNQVSAGYAAFIANKAFYDNCEELRGKSSELPPQDLDAYAHFELVAVPEHIDFGSKSKKFNSPITRKNEFGKYLCFITPPDLDLIEKKEAERVGPKAVVDALKEFGIESRVRWNFHY
jgi:hypothetical protein